MTHGTRKGSLVALSATGGVITSAGLVLAATFIVLATLPLVFLVELGFAVALGVILDTIIVRSILVTAITLVLAFPIALYIARVAQGRSKAMLLLLCLLPFWVSELVRTRWLPGLRRRTTASLLRCQRPDRSRLS